MRRLIYCAHIRLPTEKAHGLQIIKTCEALADVGVSVELVVPNRRTAFTDDPFSVYGVKKNFIISRLWCVDSTPWRWFGAFGFYLSMTTFYWSLVKKYPVNNGDSIYYTRDLLLASWLAKRGCRVFYEVHSLPDHIKPYHQKVWKNVAGLVVISDGLKNCLAKAGVDAGKILVARDAVNQNEFVSTITQAECRKQLGVPVNKKIVVYTGHLYAWKGVATLVAAARLLPEPYAVYIVGGSNEDVGRLKRQAFPSNIHMIGWKPHREINLWLAAADVAVVPTSARYEIGRVYTSPLKVFEYAAAKVPIVATDIPSTRELLTDGTAVFVEPDSAGALARGIIESVTDAGTSAARVAVAYQVAVSNSWATRAQKIASFLGFTAPRRP